MKRSFILFALLSVLPPFLQLNKLEPIPLNDEEIAIIKDTFKELYWKDYAISIFREKSAPSIEIVRKILRSYCECTDKEFEDYMNDEPLPSIKTKMDSKKFTKKDAVIVSRERAKIDFYTNEIKTLGAEWKQILWTGANSFEKKLNRRLNGYSFRYKLDLENNRLVGQEIADSYITASDSIEKAYPQFVKEFTEKIHIETQKTIQRLRQRTLRMEEERKLTQPKKPQTTTKSKKKGSPQ